MAWRRAVGVAGGAVVLAVGIGAITAAIGVVGAEPSGRIGTFEPLAQPLPAVAPSAPASAPRRRAAVAMAPVLTNVPIVPTTRRDSLRASQTSVRATFGPPVTEAMSTVPPFRPVTTTTDDNGRLKDN